MKTADQTQKQPRKGLQAFFKKHHFNATKLNLPLTVRTK